MSAVDDVASVIGGLAPVVAKIPDAVERLSAWIHGDGARPDDVLALPELPSLLKNDMETAALHKRAERDRAQKV